MKVSVSVDDALYEAACEAATSVLGEETRGSRLVQYALGELLSQARTPSFAVVLDDEEVVAALEREAERLRAQARDDFGAGWRAGVKEAARMSWSDFEVLALLAWDYDRFADWKVDSLVDELAGEESAELAHLGEWRDHEQRRRGTAYRAGFVGALREVHAKVLGGPLLDPT